MSAAIDLITPPGSPTGAAGGGDDPIDLCTSDEEEAPALPAGKRKKVQASGDDAGGSETNFQQLAAAGLGGRVEEEDDADEPLDEDDLEDAEEEDDLEDEECMEVEPAPRAVVQQAAGPSSAADGEDDDVVFAGRTGLNALSDFPHSRENCLEHKFKPGAEQTCCANCYCYVCE